MKPPTYALNVGMSRCIFVFTLSLFIAFPALSQQQPVVDTLDWKDYFPLEIGNTWEYKFGNELYGAFPEGYDFRQIVRDSVVAGLRYYVHDVKRYDAEFQLQRQESELLRYDESQRTVVKLVSSDTSQYEQVWPDPSLTCDLGAPFFSKIECNACPNCDSVHVEGHLDGYVHFELDGLTSRVVKAFYLPFSGYGIGFYHGTGVEFVVADFEQGYRRDVTFVRLDGEEYGRSEVATSVERQYGDANSAFISGVYPNPVATAARIEYELPDPHSVSIEVYDALGRRMENKALGWRVAGQHSHEIEMSDFAPGVYFVRLLLDSGRTMVTQVTVQ